MENSERRKLVKNQPHQLAINCTQRAVAQCRDIQNSELTQQTRIHTVRGVTVASAWIVNTLKGMSDERQNRLILSAGTIARQKSVVCHAKIARFCQPTKSPNFVGQDRACSIFNDFVGRLFVYRTTNLVYVCNPGIS